MVRTRRIYQQLDPKSSAYGTDTNTDKTKKSQALYENITKIQSDINSKAESMKTPNNAYSKRNVD